MFAKSGIRMMEEVFLRFPHLSEDIFNSLDNKTFASSKEVSKVWYKYLDDQTFVQERKVGLIQKMIGKFKPDFQQSIELIQANISLTQFPDCRDGSSLMEFNWLNLVDETSLHLRFSSAFDTATVQKILHEARNGNFDVVHSMIMVEFHKVYYPLSHHSRRSVPSIIYNLAHRNKHEEVKNYLRLKCRFSEVVKRLYLSKFDTEDFTPPRDELLRKLFR